MGEKKLGLGWEDSDEELLGADDVIGRKCPGREPSLSDEA